MKRLAASSLLLSLLAAGACTGSRETAPSAAREPARVDAPASAPAASADAKRGVSCDRGALARSISAPHDVPTLESTRATCAEPAALLAQIAEDETERGLTRLRAIDLLGSAGGQASVTCLTRLSGASGDLASVRRSALVALGRATRHGDVTRERAARAALGDPDQHVRAAAAALLER